MTDFRIITGDSLHELKSFDECSVDACVTDPPYGWRFMGKAWDGVDIEKRAAQSKTTESRVSSDGVTRKSREKRAEAAGAYDLSPKGNMAFQIWTEQWAREVYRVLKPGAHMLVFCGPRTYHRMASGVEDAGFEIRDQLQWLFGSGFPKSLNIGDGWGTALKPANEPICLARKPLEKGLTVAQNVLKWGTGALNIDACRISTDETLEGGSTGVRTALLNMGRTNPRPNHSRAGEPSAERRYNKKGSTDFAAMPGPRGGDSKGRWPANVIHDGSDEVLAGFPEQTSGANPTRRGAAKFKNAYGEFLGQEECESARGAETGSAARFFYSPKASKYDREAGLRGAARPTMGNGIGGQPNQQVENNRNHHPTVKPTELMQYLCRLVTPVGGTVLDPFLGSGSTAKAALIERFNVIGIELDPEYAAIAEARCRQLQTNLFV